MVRYGVDLEAGEIAEGVPANQERENSRIYQRMKWMNLCFVAFVDHKHAQAKYAKRKSSLKDDVKRETYYQ